MQVGRSRQYGQRDGVRRGRFGTAMIIILAAGIAYVAWAKLEWHRPTAELANRYKQSAAAARSRCT